MAYASTHKQIRYTAANAIRNVETTRSVRVASVLQTVARTSRNALVNALTHNSHSNIVATAVLFVAMVRSAMPANAPFPALLGKRSVATYALTHRLTATIAVHAISLVNEVSKFA